MAKKKYSFWEFCTDNTVFVIIVVLLIFGLLGVGPCVPRVQAKCITHMVIKNETLGKLSKQYYGNRNYWEDIKRQNNLKYNMLKIGQEINIYIPDQHDWYQGCTNLLEKRLEQLKIKRSESIISGIINGINAANQSSLNYTPTQKLEACRWAIATAHQESFFEFAIGGAGEIGMYQFKLNTVRLTGRWYKDKLSGYFVNMSKASDEEITRWILEPGQATEIFLLHFAHLHKHYKNLWLTWKRYNSGGEAAAYATKAIDRYWKVKIIVPINCKNNNIIKP